MSLKDTTIFFCLLKGINIKVVLSLRPKSIGFKEYWEFAISKVYRSISKNFSKVFAADKCRQSPFHEKHHTGVHAFLGSVCAI